MKGRVQVHGALLILVQVHHSPHVLAPLRYLGHELLPHNAHHRAVPAIRSILLQLLQPLLSVQDGMTLSPLRSASRDIKATTRPCMSMTLR